MLTYANNNPAVAGVDLHLHVSSFNGDDGPENKRFPSLDSGLVGAVTFARTEVPTKPFISTEFSLVSYFLQFLKDPISSQFTSMNQTYAADAANSVEYDPDGKQTVLGFYTYAVFRGNHHSPISYQEWTDFPFDWRCDLSYVVHGPLRRQQQFSCAGTGLLQQKQLHCHDLFVALPGDQISQEPEP